MTLNIKNDLQNFFQTRKLVLPSYSTVKVGGTDHEPLWQSTLTFTLYKKKYKVTSSIFSRKIDAENNVADKALKLVTSARADGVTKNKSKAIVTPSAHADVTKLFYNPSLSCPELSCSNSSKPRIVMLVDIENVPKWLDIVVEKYPHITDMMDIFGVIGEYHSLVEKVLPPKVVKIISPSSRPDGSDSCIQICVGAFLAQNKYDEYLIATNDRFAHNVVEFITAPSLFWKPCSGRVVTRLDHLESFLA